MAQVRQKMEKVKMIMIENVNQVPSPLPASFLSVWNSCD